MRTGARESAHSLLRRSRLQYFPIIGPQVNAELLGTADELDVSAQACSLWRRSTFARNSCRRYIKHHLSFTAVVCLMSRQRLLGDRRGSVGVVG